MKDDHYFIGFESSTCRIVYFVHRERKHELSRHKALADAIAEYSRKGFPIMVEAQNGNIRRIV